MGSEAHYVEVRFFCVCFLLISGLTPSSDIRIDRFKSLTCPLTISKWFVSSEAELFEVRFFRVFFLLIKAKNCNLGSTPTSDIRIERFKSLTCFFTISKGFGSSEAEYVEVRFFHVCFLLVSSQNHYLGLTLSSDIRFERFQSLIWFILQFLRGS